MEQTRASPEQDHHIARDDPPKTTFAIRNRLGLDHALDLARDHCGKLHHRMIGFEAVNGVFECGRFGISVGFLDKRPQIDPTWS